MKLFSYKNRPVHQGPFLYERLKRSEGASPLLPTPPALFSAANIDAARATNKALEEAINQHFNTYLTKSANPIASHQHPEGLSKTDIAHTLKSAAYFMDAQGVGIAALDDDYWQQRTENFSTHDTALVIVCDMGRDPRANILAKEWSEGLIHPMAELRATEIATVIANQIRILGFEATIHRQESDVLNQAACAVSSGMFYQGENGLSHPFLGKNFAFVTITTNANLPTDNPLKRRTGLAKAWQESLPFSLGLDGTQPRRHLKRKQNRTPHLSLYP